MFFKDFNYVPMWLKNTFRSGLTYFFCKNRFANSLRTGSSYSFRAR